MNLLDLIIISPIIYFSWRGFVNGLIKEVLSIVGIILALFLTFQFMDEVGSLIRPMFDSNSPAIPFVSGILIFVTTVSLVQAGAFLGRKFLEAIKLNFINRLSGLAFGLLKSGITVSVILLLLAGFGFPSEQSRQESLTYSTVIYVAPLTFDAMAFLFPGVEDFSGTVKTTLSNYNPIKNFPTLDE